MVDLEQLGIRARRVAEWSRMRMALRIVGIVALLPVLPIVVGAEALPCVAFTAVLLVMTTSLRWWSEEGVQAVRFGLWMGAVPLVVASLLPACGIGCTPDGIGDAELVCIVAGSVAGIGLALFAGRRRDSWRAWTLSVAIASVTSMLGFCIELRMASLLATLVPLAVSSIAVRVPMLLRMKTSAG